MNLLVACSKFDPPVVGEFVADNDALPARRSSHVTLRLFTSPAAAAKVAASLGPSWSAFAYGDGYMLTTGWLFQDAAGPVEGFRPAPREVLEAMQDLVRVLQPGHYSRRGCLRLIEDYLRSFRVLRRLSEVQFKAMCFCAFKRLDHPAPRNHPNDWLTLPSWGG